MNACTYLCATFLSVLHLCACVHVHLYTCDVHLYVNVSMHACTCVCMRIRVYVHQIHYILDEIIQGGMVLETSIPDVLAAVNEANALAQASRSGPLLA